MKRISIWAKLHVLPARILIIVGHIILTGIAIYWGVLSYNAGFHLNEGWLYFLILIYCSLYFVYPVKKKKAFLKNTYAVRHGLHAIMALCSFSLVLSFTNVKLQPSLNGSAAAAISINIEPKKGYKNPEAERLINSYKKGDLKKFNRSERKILKNELGYQLQRFKESKKTGNKSDGSDAGLIILTILVALAALGGVAILSCSIGCNGNDGLATIVLIFGTAAVIFGVIMIIKGQSKKNTQSNETKTGKGS